MTPEAAHENGRRSAARLARLFCKESDCDDFVGTEDFSDGDVVEAIEIHAGDDMNSVYTAHALRGAAQYWRDRAQDLEARAAALEATR